MGAEQSQQARVAPDPPGKALCIEHVEVKTLLDALEGQSEELVVVKYSSSSSIKSKRAASSSKPGPSKRARLDDSAGKIVPIFRRRFELHDKFFFQDMDDDISLVVPWDLSRLAPLLDENGEAELAVELHSGKSIRLLDITLPSTTERTAVAELRLGPEGQHKHHLGHQKSGTSGWLDAAVHFRNKEQLELTTTLLVSRVASNHVELALDLSIGLCDGFFNSSVSAPKRLLLEYLFPRLTAPEHFHGNVDVRYFYDCIGRPTAPSRSSIDAFDRKGKGKAIDPTPDLSDLRIMRPADLAPTLMPFQSRTLRWMLSREGKFANVEEGGAVTLSDLPERFKDAWRRGYLWERVVPSSVSNSEGVWVNHVTAEISPDEPSRHEKVKSVKGEDDMDVDKATAPVEEGGYGLLSDEMGLGKTIEVLGLILTHRAPSRKRLPAYYDDYLQTKVQPTGLTLIIAPAAIVAQWQNEIKKHAPTLRILRYNTVKTCPENWTPRDVADNYDVILTTFDTLRREVAIARKPHERNLRHVKEERHKYRRSMLVCINFLRVVMDEAQMVGSSVSTVSETCSLIARRFSWAVTGTPLGSSIADLQGMLKFLKVDPFTWSDSSSYLDELLKQPAAFAQLIGSMATRTLKSQIHDELSIPAQRRFIVPVELSAVERYAYDTTYGRALQGLGLDDDAQAPENAGDEPYELNRQLLMHWLTALRQACCHPQIGVENQKTLGRVLKDVGEVLDTMRENAVSAVQSDERALWFNRVKRSQLALWDKEECENLELCRDICSEAVAAIDPLADEIAGEYIAVFKDLQAERRRSDTSASEETSDDQSGPSVARALECGAREEEKASESSDTPISNKEKQLSQRLGPLRNRLTEALYVKHMAQFFAGSAYFNMGKFPEEESGAYQAAEMTRQLMLKPYENRVSAALKRLKLQFKEREQKAPLKRVELGFSSTDEKPGLETASIWEEVTATTKAINGFADLLWEWRDKMRELIFTRVSISGEDATGEEYAERAETQETLDIYLQAYGLVLADMRLALTGERSTLMDSIDLDTMLGATKGAWSAAEGSSRRKRKGKGLAGKTMFEPTLANGATAGEVLRYKLMKAREKVKTGDGENILDELTPLRHLVVRLRDTIEAVAEESKEREDEDTDDEADERAAIETEIAKTEMVRLRKEIPVRDKVVDRLMSEYREVMRAFNCRIAYYAQLQVISDSVGDPDLNRKSFKSITLEKEHLLRQEARLEDQITRKSTQRRYLETLAETTDGEVEPCIICAEPYSRGVVTACAHLFCARCFKLWFQKSRECAICKRVLLQGSWQSVSFDKKLGKKKGGDVKAEQGTSKSESQLESQSSADLSKSIAVRQPELSQIPRDELNEISEVATSMPLSSKSDLIAKHIKHIRTDDPAAKVVVFSAWMDSLELLMQALTRNGLRYCRLETQGKSKKEQVVEQFVKDPNIAAFLLHTKSQAAGLTLVRAEHVILVEPLLHPALELQAVGRVHRIGQNKSTSVWQYAVADTVDMRIAELRARQGSSLFFAGGGGALAMQTRTQKESEALTADISAASANKGANSSEEAVADVDDVAQCLFTPEHYATLQKALFPAQANGHA